ncbi:tetratricopeptide repeat-containing sensor histidine kinase [Foetidibacter luteolus]|uniref:tetratricopeptide repeat-containing sensor histidine kinase n=1 Tax=Foetidibacter luteolus TaxID=2608880 RepID=UPI00129A8FDD|nr:tetratricopeptide repeat-containing sensor histidine kinase [Foetidibacter luteolus]
MKKLLLLILLPVTITAQKTGRLLVDSLLHQALPIAGDDTIKARLYHRAFNELTYINIEEAMQIANAGLAHAEKMKWPKGIAVFNDNIAQAYSSMGNFDSAISHFSISLKTHTKAGDKRNMASTNNNMGTAAQNIRSDYTAAVSYYFKALALCEEIKDSTLMSATLGNIAAVYMIQKNYPKALAFNQRALIIREKLGKPDEIANTLENIGKVYISQQHIDKAKGCFNKALAMYQSSGNLMGLASVWSSLSLTYGNDYRSAIEARIQSKELWDEVNPMHSDAITNTGNLGLAYLDVVRYDTSHKVKYSNIMPGNKTALLKKAEEHLSMAIQLSGQTGAIESQAYFTGLLAELQEFKGDYKNAYYNFKNYAETRDSIYSQENKNKIAEAESQRQIAVRDKQLELNKLALMAEKRQRLAMLTGLVLLAIIGALLYKQNRLRKKNNTALRQLNTELEDANRLKAKFFAILTHDLRNPVASLLDFLRLQKEEPGLLSAAQAAFHQQKLTASAETLLENMETMLLWSKEQMKNFKPMMKDVEVSALFSNLQKLFSETKTVQLLYNNPQNLSIYTDENYLHTIMYNLTANAVKALQHTPGATITWQAYEKKGATILSVTDNGPGINQNVLQTLNNVTDAVNAKTGMGLHIVRDLAKAINCSITVKSAPGSGTTFILFD